MGSVPWGQLGEQTLSFAFFFWSLGSTFPSVSSCPSRLDVSPTKSRENDSSPATVETLRLNGGGGVGGQGPAWRPSPAGGCGLRAQLHLAFESRPASQSNSSCAF